MGASMGIVGSIWVQCTFPMNTACVLHNLYTGLASKPEAFAAVGVAPIPAEMATTIAVAASFRQRAFTRGDGAVSIS